jgi:hypothetical protein
MKRFKVLLVMSLVLVLAVVLPLGPAFGAKGDTPPKPGPDEGTGNQDLYAALPNLSFPVVMTSVVEQFFYKMWVDTDGDGAFDNNEWFVAYDVNENGVLDDDLDGVLEEGEDSILPGAGDPMPIPVTEVLSDTYGGTYPGQVEPDGTDTYWVEYLVGDDGCWVDLVDNETGEAVPDGVADVYTELFTEWAKDQEPWYPQPRMTTSLNPNDVWNVEFVSDYSNSWQADWEYITYDPEVDEEAPVIPIDFIDWGNPLENTYPLVGYRFPVEVTLHTKRTADTLMTGYFMACIENPSTKIELFGTANKETFSNFPEITFENYFATVITDDFIAEVWNPDGTIERLNLGPGIGPSGKINFASDTGGWIPKMTGVHRIWFHVTDPLIDLTWAKVNNDEHYIFTTGCMVEELSPGKILKSGVIGNSTFVDVLVKNPNGGGGRKVK